MARSVPPGAAYPSGDRNVGILGRLVIATILVLGTGGCGVAQPSTGGRSGGPDAEAVPGPDLAPEDEIDAVDLAVAPDGTLHATWREVDRRPDRSGLPEYRTLYASRPSGGANWSVPAEITADTPELSETIDSVELVLDDGGLVAFYASFGLHASRSTDGRRWSRPVRISGSHGSSLQGGTGVRSLTAAGGVVVWVDERYRESDRRWWKPLGGWPWSDSPDWAELVLVSSSGRRIDPAEAAADPEIELEVGQILGGSAAVYSLGQLEVGTWTVEVTGVSLADPLVPVGYGVNAWMEDPAVILAGSVAPASVPAGTPIDLFGTVHESGGPLAGAGVSAHVVLPDGSAAEILLADDGAGADVTAGDGIYSGRLSDTAQPGFYRIAFTAAGTTGSGAAFSRQDFALATASASSTSFSGSFRDFGRDTDGDGLFNHLVVEVDLDVTTETDYRVFGVLTDPAGNRYEASFTGSLAAGPTAVELLFDGERIFDNGVDGPYTLSEVRLVEEGDLTLLPLAELFDARLTAAYSFEEFEHSAIRLGGNGSAEGIDLDANGLYDLLDVRVEVEVDQAAFYQWSGLLTDSGGTELGFDTGLAFLSSGANELRFVFDGSAIGRNGVDGPYLLSSLLVLGGGSSLVAGTAFETPPFLASQFEGFAVDTTPPEIEVTLDPSVLWPPDHRLVELTATISVRDERGVPVIAGTPFKVVQIISRWKAYGETPEEMAADMPLLSLEQANAAFEYYRAHQEEIDADMERRMAKVERLRETWAAPWPAGR